MKIERIYNNNVILAHDDKNEEIIAIGKGLAFGRHVGDTIEKDRIEKLFILRDKSIQSKLQAILSDIPSVYLEIVEELIQEIHATSNLTLNESIYLTLTDHISVSLEREKQGILCRNPLLPEIKQFYPQEYRLARLAVGIIRRYLQVTISDDEVGFITLHIVNASVNQGSCRLTCCNVTSDHLKIREFLLDHLYAVDNVRGVSVRGVKNNNIDLCIYKSFCSFKNICCNSDCGTAEKSSVVILSGVRILDLFLDIFDRNESL